MDGFWLKIRSLIETGELYKYNSTTFIHLFPVKHFTVFENVYILTFMFEAQDQWALFKMKDISYEFIGVEKNGEQYSFTEDTSHVMDILKGVENKIQLCGDDQRFAIGKDQYSFSSSSFNGSKKDLKDPFYPELKNCAAYMKRRGFDTRNVPSEAKQAIPSKKLMWTCYKVGMKLICSKDVTKRNFVRCNARGENRWQDKTYLMYMVNRFRDPHIKRFFEKQKGKNISLNDDDFAISEMVQWIWRSAIRNGKEIKIYIPSDRMRRLLKNWLKEVS